MDSNVISARLKTLLTIEDVDSFLANHHVKRDVPLHIHLNDYLAERKMSVAEVIQSSNINKNYCYNIINGTRSNPGRDKIIALCIGLLMSLDETQETLDIAIAGRLHINRTRDIFIAYALNNRIGSVTKTNLLLEEHDLAPLNV